MTVRGRRPFAIGFMLTTLLASVSAFQTDLDLDLARWKAADSNSAWDDAIFRWRNCDRPEGKSFSGSITNFLHADHLRFCDLARREGRCGTILCLAHNNASTDPADMAGAGAYVVWNAISEVRVYAKDVYAAHDQLAIGLRLKSEKFTDVFSPKSQDMDGINMLPSLLTIPVTAGGAMFLKHSFDKMIRDDFSTDVSKNMTNAIISAGYSAVEQYALAIEVPDREMSYNSILETAIGQWPNQIDLILNNLFSGKDEHIRALTEILKDGRLAVGRGNSYESPGKWANTEVAKRAFYAVAIPAVWRETGQAPAVIDAGECKGHDAIPDIVSAGKLSYSCYKDRAYFLVAAPDGSKGKKPMGLPQGVSKLDGKKWGTVEHHDLIAGAVETYKKAGNKNSGDVKPDPNDKDIGDALYDHNIRAPGIVNIPVCSAEEAFNNWVDGGDALRGGFFPCNN